MKDLKREIIQTSDGSTTFFLPEWNETYHSKHGAIQEAYHVFIKNGLSLFEKNSVAILEIGFGTGLNAIISLLESIKNKQNIDYVGVEAYPISIDFLSEMNYSKILLNNDIDNYYKKIHETHWETKEMITTQFFLTKRNQFFESISDENQFDLIYFDAFGFRVQPELWSESIFKKMYLALKKNGILVTYACRTSIKNAMIDSGFTVEKLPGAPGKREMLRGRKI